MGASCFISFLSSTGLIDATATGTAATLEIVVAAIGTSSTGSSLILLKFSRGIEGLKLAVETEKFSGAEKLVVLLNAATVVVGAGVILMAPLEFLTKSNRSEVEDLAFVLLAVVGRVAALTVVVLLLNL